MHSDPPCTMTIGSWLALVLTVNGLVVFVPFDPYVAVHVDPTAGTVATKAAQLDGAETPAAIETVSLVVPVPCRYSGLPAALTVGAPSDASASEPNISTRMPTTTQPSQRLP